MHILIHNSTAAWRIEMFMSFMIFLDNLLKVLIILRYAQNVLNFGAGVKKQAYSPQD